MSKKETTPLSLGRVILGQNVHGFFVRTKAEPGVMARILTAAAKFNVTIINIYNSTPTKRGGSASFVVFYDFSEATASPQEVRKAMEEAVENTEVELLEPVLPGVVADTKHYPLLLLGERAIIFREAVLRGWFVGIRRRFGTGGEAFLYYEGFEAGQEIFDTYTRLGISPHGLWTMFCMAFIAIGGAKDMKFEMKEEGMTLRIWENMECSLGRSSNKPFSQFLRGAIAGFASKFFKANVIVIETKCIAKGDPYCEFEVTIA
ncbi:MAG: V4R domain-containing protein [Candidatus Nezhaarchaeales archaeon]